MSYAVQSPYAYYTDRDGSPLEGGYLYFGVAGLPAETNPTTVYWDEALTIPIAQPVRTRNGFAYNNGTPGTIWIAGDASLTVKNKNGIVVYSAASNNSIFDQIPAFSASTGSGSIGHIASGAGAVATTVRDKLRQIVNVKDYGAVGNGVTDDTFAIQAALNTGKSISLVCGETYIVSAALSAMANGQIINLNGSMISFSGSASGFTITGGLRNITICDGEIEGQNMTGGYVIDIRNADRCTITNVRVYNPYNFLYAEQANLVSVDNVWVNNIRGAYGVHWYGTATKRSDILRLIGVNLSSQQNAVGIMWDGNCNTLQVQAVTIVQPSIGVQVRNTSGGPVPLFGLFDDLEIDFPLSHGIKLDAGEDFYFTPLLYCHGSVNGSGIYVGAAISQDRTIITGGKITSHARYGIENNSIRVKVSNPVIFNNTLGNYQTEDFIYTQSPRFEVDGTGFFALNTGNPVFNWDSLDVDGYIRSTNVRYTNVNAITRMTVSDNTDAIELYVGGVLKRVSVGAVDSGGAGYRMLRVLN